MEEASGDLQQDLRLRVATHRAEHRHEASCTSGQCRRQRVGRASPGPELGGMALDEVEADPAIVQVDAGVRFDEVAAEPRRVRLDQRHADAPPVAIDSGRAQIRRVAVDAWRHTPARGFQSDHVETLVDRVDERVAVGVFVEGIGTVVPGGGRRFDQEVGPAWVVGVVRQIEPLGESRRSDHEVSLRVRCDRVEIDAERRHAEGIHPVRLDRAEVVGIEQSVAEFHQAVAERPEVEAVATADRQRGKHERGTRSPNDSSGRGGLFGQLRQIGPAGRVEAAKRSDEQRTRREPLGCKATCRRKDRVERQRAEPFVQGDPTVDAPRHRDRADVELEGHLAEAIGPQHGRVGSGAGSAGCVECVGRPGRAVTRRIVDVDQCEEVPADAAEVGTGDRDRCVGGDRRVDGVASSGEYGDASGGGELVGTRHHVVRRPCGGSGSSGRHVGDVTSRAGCGLVPLTALGEDVAEHLGTVGHDAVHAEIEQPVHFVGVVDRPHVHRHAASVGVADEPLGDDRDTLGSGRRPIPHRHLRDSYGSAGGSSCEAQRGDFLWAHARQQFRTEQCAELGEARVAERSEADAVDRLQRRINAASGPAAASDLQSMLNRTSGNRSNSSPIDGIDARPSTRTSASSSAVISAIVPSMPHVRVRSGSWNAIRTPSALRCTSVSR